MKFKKILSSVIAAAMAVTTFSAFSTTATAADVSTTNYITINGATSNWAVNFQQVVEKQTIEEGTKTYDLSFDLGYADTLITSSSQYNGVQILLVDTTGSKFYEDISIDVIVDGEEKLSDAVPTYDQYAWDSNISQTVAAYVYSITDADSESIGTISSNVTFRVTVTYEIPTTDVWVDNGDGSYSLTRGTADSVPSYTFVPSSLGNLTSVSCDISIENGDDNSNGKIGACYAVEGNNWGGWSQSTWGVDDTSCTLNWDGPDKQFTSNPEFQVDNLAEGATITISNIKTLEKYKLYEQYTTDGSAMRVAMLISEDYVTSAEKVTFEFYNGTKYVDVESTKCYRTIKACGDTITAPEGCVFVAYCITDIPSGTTVDCTGVTV